jgi:carboxyl-terminal processing protease
MIRSRVLFLVLSLVVLLPLATGTLWSQAVRRGADDSDSIYRYLAIFSEVFGLVRDSYVDPTEPAQLLAGAMEGATEALDPFSAYVPAASRTDYEQALAIGRSRSGIAIARDHGIAFVLAVEEGSPGATAGFQAGDILAEIDGRSTRDLPHWQLDRLFAGELGSRLACRVVRQGDTHRLDLELADYTPPAPRLETPHEGVGLLRIAHFEAATAERVRPLLAELAGRGVDKLLLDLRGLAGGPGAAGYAVAGLFAEGELGRLVRRGETLQEFRGAAPAWQGDVVVLVDAGTQGPAEALASALRARTNAKLVGVRTFGWAGERDFVAVGDGAQLYLTTAFYTQPDGALLNSGLAPDLQVDDLQRSFGERDKPLGDLILERGIEVLSGAAGAARQAA